MKIFKYQIEVVVALVALGINKHKMIKTLNLTDKKCEQIISLIKEEKFSEIKKIKKYKNYFCVYFYSNKIWHESIFSYFFNQNVKNLVYTDNIVNFLYETILLQEQKNQFNIFIQIFLSFNSNDLMANIIGKSYKSNISKLLIKNNSFLNKLKPRQLYHLWRASWPRYTSNLLNYNVPFCQRAFKYIINDELKFKSKFSNNYIETFNMFFERFKNDKNFIEFIEQQQDSKKLFFNSQNMLHIVAKSNFLNIEYLTKIINKIDLFKTDKKNKTPLDYSLDIDDEKISFLLINKMFEKNEIMTKEILNNIDIEKNKKCFFMIKTMKEKIILSQTIIGNIFDKNNLKNKRI
jgi:hypothetical protein